MQVRTLRVYRCNRQAVAGPQRRARCQCGFQAEAGPCRRQKLAGPV